MSEAPGEFEKSQEGPPAAEGNLLTRILRHENLSGVLGPLIALAVVWTIFAVADGMYGSGRFASMRNTRVISNQTAIVAVAALGMTVVIIAGGIDLSAGTALTLAATTMAWSLKAEWPIAAVIAATIAVGCACGLVNGVLIGLRKIVPFIVTLGTMTIFLGLGSMLASESTIFPPRERIPGWVMSLCSTRPPDFHFGFVPNIPLGVLVAAVLAVLVILLLHGTVFGRHVFALGSNEAAARLCGVPIARTKIAVYVLAGLFVGLAGIYHFANLKQGNPIEGLGLELQVIAAVVIGGGSLSGGRGSVLGTCMGAAIMAVIRIGCGQLEIPNPVTQIVIGAIIIAAVDLDRWRRAAEA